MKSRIKKVRIYDDILHLWFSEHVDKLPVYTKEKKFSNSTNKKIVFFLKVIVKDIIRIFSIESIKQNNNVWLFIGSINNYSAISFLKEELYDSKFVKPKTGLFDNKDIPGEKLVYRWKLFHTIKGLLFFFIYLKYTNRKKYAVMYWPYFFYTIGLYEESLRYLRKYSPSTILFSNDHSVEQRALLLAAKQLNIKTIYIQHASVTSTFPPLRFDLSLLEGQDAYNKYKKIGKIEGKVELIGMPKFDDYLKYRSEKKTIEKIGICFNMTDNIEDVEKTTEQLQKGFREIEFILRPHPSENRRTNKDVFEYSDSKKTNAFEFLRNVDAIIAGNSSIHLEAAILNVLPIYFEFSETLLEDYYGFVNNNISIHAQTFNDLLNYIENVKSNKPLIFMEAKYYNSVIGTPLEGKVKSNTINLINKFIKNNEA